MPALRDAGQAYIPSGKGEAEWYAAALSNNVILTIESPYTADKFETTLKNRFNSELVTGRLRYSRYVDAKTAGSQFLVGSNEERLLNSVIDFSRGFSRENPDMSGTAMGMRQFRGEMPFPTPKLTIPAQRAQERWSDPNAPPQVRLLPKPAVKGEDIVFVPAPKPSAAAPFAGPVSLPRGLHYDEKTGKWYRD